MFKISVMTGTRAEYGLLRNLIYKLNDNKEVDLRLMVTGTHLSDAFGNTKNEIVSDGFTFDQVKIPVDTSTKLNMAHNTATATALYADYFNSIKPDLLVVLGDRYEAFSATTAAFILSIPVAHISGGDVTEGALDDGFRHCITKMSTLHFPGCEDSAKRIIQMGESPKSVFSVGDPGVENCLNTKFMTVKEIEDSLNFPLVNKDYAVVTFHPVTQENGTGAIQLNELIVAMDEHKDLQYIVTTANADAGGNEINAIWESQSKLHKNWIVVPSLGVVRYLSAVKNCVAVIGNSSSGIVEAPALGVPTVNIGRRQKGRPSALSVINCEPNRKDISSAIEKAKSKAHQELSKTCESPFGKGNTSSDIVKILLDYLKNAPSDLAKQFYDIKF